MRRVFWVAVGAAGGVFVYKRGGQLLTEARERGLVANIGAATVGATTLVGQAATLLSNAGSGAKRVSDLLAHTPGVAPAANRDMTQSTKGRT